MTTESPWEQNCARLEHALDVLRRIGRYAIMHLGADETLKQIDMFGDKMQRDATTAKYDLGNELSDSKRMVGIVRAYIATLNDEERTDFFDQCLEGYCRLCGGDLPCYCSPVYDE